MILPNDYDSARGFDGSAAPKLAPGGHVCRIRGARMDRARSGRDMLVIAFDIAEGGPFDGYYAERFRQARQRRSDATWPGVFRTTLTNAEGRTNGFFKGLIEAIEASNPGFNFRAAGCDENKLNGKIVGFNFGEEEYADRNTGKIRVSVKPQYAVSAAKVREGVIPPERKPYKGDRGASGSGAAQQFIQQTSMAQVPNGGVADDDVELPF